MERPPSTQAKPYERAQPEKIPEAQKALPTHGPVAERPVRQAPRSTKSATPSATKPKHEKSATEVKKTIAASPKVVDSKKTAGAETKPPQVAEARPLQKAPEAQTKPVDNPQRQEASDTAGSTAVVQPLPELKLTPDSLPARFQKWTLDRGAGGAQSGCLLRSRTVVFHDGYEASSLFVEVDEQSLTVKTESHLDMSYPNVGLRIGEGPLMTFNGAVRNETVEMRKNLTAALKEAGEVTLYLGFWPTWPVTQTQEIKVSLDGFAAGLAAFDLCRKW